MMATEPCMDGTGCVRLKLLMAAGFARSWYYVWAGSKKHEKIHADAFHETSFVPSKKYAEGLAHCYQTEKEANCWQAIAEQIVPFLNFYKAGLENLGLDGITSGPEVTAFKEAIAKTEADLIAAEAKCKTP